MNSPKKKIIRLLGVGFDAEDGHVRITKGSSYDVVMGSSESHTYIHEMIAAIEAEIEKRGQSLDDLSPDELTAIIESLQKGS